MSEREAYRRYLEASGELEEVNDKIERLEEDLYSWENEKYVLNLEMEQLEKLYKFERPNKPLRPTQLATAKELGLIK